MDARRPTELNSRALLAVTFGKRRSSFHAPIRGAIVQNQISLIGWARDSIRHLKLCTVNLSPMSTPLRR